MRRALATLVAFGALAAPANAEEVRSGSAYARLAPTEIVLGNSLVERRWSRPALRTTLLSDKRGQDRVWSRDTPDFTLTIGAATIGSDAFTVTGARAEKVAGGALRLTMTLTGPAGITATRTAEVAPGVAGLRTQTTLSSPAGVALSGATLEQAATGAAAPALHAFRAGADWRDPSWTGPDLQVGDPHAGTWRVSRSAARGEALDGAGQWLSASDGGRSLFLVREGTDFPSAWAAYDGTHAALRDDYGRDVILLGPLEESGHIENPTGSPGRPRIAGPGEELALDPVFVGFGEGDGDEAWQFAKHLRSGLTADPGEVVFNTDKLDSNRISTGAKDDTDLAMVEAVAPIVKRLGAETFVLDDGWQGTSGDWVPDPKRFPDATFAAVREAIAPMKLGLWMSPMHFHPTSSTAQAHPEWQCQPYATGLGAYNGADQTSGSNEAGIVPWGPAAIPFIEDRITTAIERWGATYFKFDFIAWLDCAGQGDVHAFRAAFVAMLDRLRAAHPDVTLQTDETNDYRLFPFASTTRGPTWFQNGHPTPERLLHNLWNLSPYVPSWAIGQHVLGGSGWKDWPVATSMAAALASHITLWDDPRKLDPAVVDEAASWIGFYKAHRSLFAGGVTYPLLDDPLEGGWAALQTWDPDRGAGALLAFRQDSADAARTIGLRNVPAGREFRLTRAPDGADLGTATSEQLRSGLRVEIPQARGASVITITPL
jgi:hypothetical protein